MSSLLKETTSGILGGMSTRLRLVLGFGMVLSLLIVVTVTGVWSQSRTVAELQRLASERLPVLRTESQASELMLSIAAHMRDALVLDDEKSVKAALAAVTSDYERFSQAMKAVASYNGSQQETDAQGSVNKAIEVYAAAQAEFLKAATGGDLSSAKDVMLSKVRPAQRRLLDELQGLVAKQQDVVHQQAADTVAAALKTRLVMVLLAAAAILAGLGAAFWIIRNLLSRLGGEPQLAAYIAARIAAGDLTTAVPVKPGDDGSLLAAMSKMQQSLIEVVSRVRAGTGSVAAASSEIAQGNADLSARTDRQVNALQQTATSMVQMSATLKSTSDNAYEATELASEASSVAERGGRMVKEVVATMDDIQSSAKRIADIIGVIDGIAFQTNILALNAAVEAARAGEQGRGFAVVAGEVRSLAQRSATAAKEIKALIGASVEKVDAGSSLVQQTGNTMADIVAQVRKVSELIKEISNATAEQTAGIDNVNHAVGDIERTTQQNAALVQQSASAAENLKDQAQALSQVVAQFELVQASMPRA